MPSGAFKASSDDIALIMLYCRQVDHELGYQPWELDSLAIEESFLSGTYTRSQYLQDYATVVEKMKELEMT